MKIAIIGNEELEHVRLLALRQALVKAGCRIVVTPPMMPPKLVIHEIMPLVCKYKPPPRKHHIEINDKCPQHRAGTKKERYTA